jgi:hypothetical protein
MMASSDESVIVSAVGRHGLCVCAREHVCMYVCMYEGCNFSVDDQLMMPHKTTCLHDALLLCVCVCVCVWV